ncbi:hypothetical protein GCM10027456_78780 [Kineosporia babensis]
MSQDSDLHQSHRRALIPDLEGASLATLRGFEEALLMLDDWDVVPDDPDPHLATCHDCRGSRPRRRRAPAKQAVPDQEHTAETHGRLLAPLGRARGRHTGPGRYEYAPDRDPRRVQRRERRGRYWAQALGHPGLDPAISQATEHLAGSAVYS